MTVEELINELIKLPQEAIVMYKHNKYGRINIDTVKFDEELLWTGGYIRTVTLEGMFKEEDDAVQ